MQERLDLCMVRGQLLMNAAQDSGAAPSTILDWTREHGNMDGISFLCTAHFKYVFPFLSFFSYQKYFEILWNIFQVDNCILSICIYIILYWLFSGNISVNRHSLFYKYRTGWAMNCQLKKLKILYHHYTELSHS